MMAEQSSFLISWLQVSWEMIAESAFYLFCGFILAGVMRALITPAMISRLFGQSRFSQIYKASLIGIPLPLCSCSVLPVAAQLRRSGLSREGTVSFLISTPETGIDSIALSAKLLGPIFAVVRPIAALIIAIMGGLIARLLIPSEPEDLKPKELLLASPKRESLFKRLKDGQKYVVKDMFPELAYYLFWGYLLAGLAAALIPDNLLTSKLSAGWLQYLLIIAVSLPVYVCATSSTPLAATLLALGIMPGAVLVFLLVGPATNLTSLVVQKQIFGLRGAIVMTFAILVGAIGCGILFDYFIGDRIGSFSDFAHSGEHEIGGFDFIAGLLLTLLMVYHTLKHYFGKMQRRVKG